MKANYSDVEKELIGREIANLFAIPVSREYHGRFVTSWGTKTAIGIFETVRRIGQEIEAGTITSTLIKNK